MSIKWVVFDLGNVVVDLAIEQVHENISLQTGKPLSQIQAVFADRFHLGTEEYSIHERFQLGLVSEEEYFDTLYELLDGLVSQEDLRAHSYDFVSGENQETLELIQALHGKIKLGCISNTNAHHWNNFEKNLTAFNYFEVKIASHLTGIAKPDARLFQQFCELAEAKPSECLFIDDLPQNVAGALACGWQAIHYDRAKPLKDCIDDVDAMKPLLA